MTSDNIVKRKRLVRLLCGVISIILASTAVMLVTFIDNTLLLTLVLIPCVITLSITIIPTPVSSKNILISGVITGIVSLIVIVYVLTTHFETVRPYLGFK